MSERHSVATFIRVQDRTNAGTRRWYVGPFMPHAGSAVDDALDRLDDSAPDGVTRTMSIETLFLASGESDLQGFK